MGKPRTIYEKLPQLEESDIGRVLEVLAERCNVRRTEFNTDLSIVGSIRRFARAVGVLVNENDYELDHVALRGMKVLDLACGNGKKVDSVIPAHLMRTMEPWLCRALAVLGADVTGVDIHFPKYITTYKKGKRREQAISEPWWRFVQRDLIIPGALDRDTFPDASFDAVYCYKFIGADISGMNAPEIEIIRTGDASGYEKIVREIKAGIERVLRENGTAVVHNTIYKKIDGTLEVS